jgi:hypothetical protein
MVTVGIYIYINGVARRIELFDDEKISINSSVQNASDISKVYTDFSQSFTVPANENNNRIFSHWYDNSIDGGFDAKKRVKAYIELDTIPFRKGNIQLEKATFKQGYAQDYTITFFGSLVSLKDIFNGKLLSDLDYSAYSFAYSGTEVVSRVTGGVNNDVKFPLITSNRLWSDSGVEDITTVGGMISPSELFPALRLNKVFEAIEDYYGITFNGNFLNDERFTNAFLWLKNADVFNVKGNLTRLDLTSVTGTAGFATADLTNNKVLLLNQPTLTGGYNQYRVRSIITSSVTNINYFINTYKDGNLYSRVGGNTDFAPTLVLIPPSNSIEEGFYTFEIETLGTMNYSVQLEFFMINFNSSNVPVSDTTYSAFTSTVSSAQGLDLSSYMPEIKVEDFFSGILKMFNLTCLSYTDNVYEIEQLESWYTNGDIKDITQYVLSDDLSIGKLETFNKINFNYIKSQSFMNVNYFSNNAIEYGDLKADLDSDGGDYSVQLPFENLLFNKFTGQNLQVGYSLKTDFKAYIPKPVILYDFGSLLSCDFYIGGIDTPTTNATTYNCFGQDTIANGFNYTSNFGADISSLYLTSIQAGLYYSYYNSYLQNIYNIKSRKYSVKAKFPISLLTSIKLNTRLIIRDRIYIINNMKIDLTSGEVDLELISDFRITTPNPAPTPPLPTMVDYSQEDYTSDYNIT